MSKELQDDLDCALEFCRQLQIENAKLKQIVQKAISALEHHTALTRPVQHTIDVIDELKGVVAKNQGGKDE